MGTLTTQNRWVTPAGIDFLQLITEGGGVVAGIDSTGAGYGGLAGGGVTGSIAINQVAFGAGTNQIQGNAGFTFEVIGGIEGVLTSNLEFFVLSLTGGVFQIQNSGTGGSTYRDTGGGGIQILNSNATTGGITIQNDSSDPNGGIQLLNSGGPTNTGNVGTFISDTSGSGIVIKTTGSQTNVSMILHNTASYSGVSDTGSQFVDDGPIGVIINASTAPGILSLNPSGTPTLIGGHLNAESNTDFSGVAAIIGSTSVAIAFNSNFTGTNAPLVVLTPLANPTTAGVYWVTMTGTAGAWTGFTVHIVNSTTISFNYIVIGNKS